MNTASAQLAEALTTVQWGKPNSGDYSFVTEQERASVDTNRVIKALCIAVMNEGSLDPHYQREKAYCLKNDGYKYYAFKGFNGKAVVRRYVDLEVKANSFIEKLGVSFAQLDGFDYKTTKREPRYSNNRSYPENPPVPAFN